MKNLNKEEAQKEILKLEKELEKEFYIIGKKFQFTKNYFFFIL